MVLRKDDGVYSRKKEEESSKLLRLRMKAAEFGLVREMRRVRVCDWE